MRNRNRSITIYKKKLRYNKRESKKFRLQQSTNNWLKIHNYPMFRNHIREKILEFSMECFRDLDGDIVHYAGMTYHVDILRDSVLRLNVIFLNKNY